MNFLTPVDIRKPETGISYMDSVLLLGSCFAEHIGKRLTEGKFHVDVNPFGVLFNPASVAQALRRLLQPETWHETDLFLHEGLYHSWAHHSRFSDVSATACLHRINTRLRSSAARLRRSNWLLVTFGTAYVYRLKASGQIVANCHKMPDRMFERDRLSVAQIADDWEATLAALWRMNPALKTLFTVSPVRHRKEGAHENQLSKAILLLAVEQLQAKYPEQVLYFPAYELMMDELRDYRFYAEDMLHPSETAVQYIWERFAATYPDKAAQKILREVEDIQRALNHRPLNPEGEAYKQFLTQTMLKLEQFYAKYPYLCPENEVEKLHEI
ncbi:MAG: GSCFA domain-containing protein [Tannerella sp.]|jgi:hypothetical protein|nr:GSCFA domain-containing protein [Tannerella sp.]